MNHKLKADVTYITNTAFPHNWDNVIINEGEKIKILELLENGYSAENLSTGDNFFIRCAELEAIID